LKDNLLRKDKMKVEGYLNGVQRHRALFDQRPLPVPVDAVGRLAIELG